MKRREFIKDCGMMTAGAVLGTVKLDARPVEKETEDAIKMTKTRRAPEFLPEWKEGWMDIHSIATGKGDCTFMVFPDGTKMMVDAGDMSHTKWEETSPALPDDSKTPAQWIADYVKHFAKGAGKENAIDYFMLSHFHSDHFGNQLAMKDGPDYQRCGLTELADYIHLDKIVDRDYPNYDYPSREYILNCAKGASENLIKFMDWQVRNNGVKAEKFVIGSHKQFALRYKATEYKDFDVFNIASNGRITTGKGLKWKEMRPGADPMKYDENMFSNVIRVRYGKFAYYNGGDLSGHSYGASNGQTLDRNFETQVADVCGPVNVIKADHHGWKDSSNPEFLMKMKPDAVIITASHKNHPWHETMARYMDPQYPGKQEVFVTSEAGRSTIGEAYWKNFVACGHVVVRVYEGGTRYQIFVLDAKSTDYPIIYKSEIRSL